MVWKDHGEMKLIIEKEPFDKGNFRKAFKAIEYSSDKIWVVKRYKEKAIKNLENLNLGHEEHARKQVQMHTVARNLAERMKKHAPKEFGETFQYDRRRTSDCGRIRCRGIYINNDGACGTTVVLFDTDGPWQFRKSVTGF